MVDITIGVVTNRPQFNEWILHQLKKQTRYLKSKGLSFEVIVATENPEQQEYFKNTKNIEGLYSPLIVNRIIKEPMSVGAKRNKICSVARGEFIGFMDDDDWYPDYRFHFQWSQLFRYPNMHLSVVDRFLCYDRSTHDSFWVGTLSECSLFFRRDYYKAGYRFKEDAEIGEGNIFIDKNSKVIVEPDIELFVAITHDDNVCRRIYDKENGDMFLQKGFPFPLDDFEKKFLSIN